MCTLGGGRVVDSHGALALLLAGVARLLVFFVTCGLNLVLFRLTVVDAGTTIGSGTQTFFFVDFSCCLGKTFTHSA